MAAIPATRLVIYGHQPTAFFWTRNHLLKPNKVGPILSLRQQRGNVADHGHLLNLHGYNHVTGSEEERNSLFE
jgi:hypothetical protein